MRKLILLAVLLLLAVPALAQDKTSVWDWSHRTQLSLNGGWLGFKPYGSDVQAWQGADVAFSAAYSLHERVSAYAVFEHGFPVNSEDGHRNIARLGANFRAYPAPGVVGDRYGLFLGAGPGWFGGNSVKDNEGFEAHVTGTASLSPRINLAAMYAHSFANDGDFDFYRVALVGRVFP